MKKATVMVAALLAVGIATGVSAERRDILVSFDGGVGVIPAQNVSGAMNPDGTFPDVRRNVVRGVVPAGGPWRIADLRASVDTYGRIKVRGRGLLLASALAGVAEGCSDITPEPNDEGGGVLDSPTHEADQMRQQEEQQEENQRMGGGGGGGARR